MATIQPSYKLFIDGEFVGAEGGASLDVFNPATGEKISKIADASKADVDRAVAAARKAFESFRRTSVYERSALLNRAFPLFCGRDFGRGGQRQYAKRALSIRRFTRADRCSRTDRAVEFPVFDGRVEARSVTCRG